MQVRRWERAIWLSTYYTGRVDSILGQNLTSARVTVSASFFGHTIALGSFGFFAENQSRDF